MATLDEIFAAMPEATAADDRECLVIDPVLRTISVPDTQRLFGVTGDELADRKYFICPRYVGDGLDLAGMFLRINYRNANGQEDGYLVNDLQIQGEYVTFSWQLTEKVTLYQGTIRFAVCADLPSTTGRNFPDWNTTTASGEVLEGLHPDLGDVEAETSDVVTQLRAEVSAQTAAVEAAGAAQTKAVQNAAAAATAAAQDQIQAKGTATLATIPADYTTMAGKVNNLANAIKGTAAGEIVRLDDVSPVEHHPAVMVRPKNLFNISNIAPTTDTSSAYISEVGENYLVITTKEDYTSGGYKTTGKTLREICPLLEVGKSYTLSGNTESKVNPIVYIGESWKFGTSKVITEAMLKYNLVFYGLSAAAGEGTGDCKISYIQIEEGDTATEYTPYVAPETVTMTRCGKNLLDIAAMTGTNLTVNEDGSCTITKTLADMSETTERMEVALPAGAYVFSAVTEEKTDGINVIRVVPVYEDGTVDLISFPLSGNSLAITLTQRAVAVKFGLASSTAVGESVALSNIMLEPGAVATEYADYTGETFTPLEDGTVGGVTSLAPTMSLLTDASGVIVDCEYNRDTGKVIQRLEAAIAALGGTI